VMERERKNKKNERTNNEPEQVSNEHEKNEWKWVASTARGIWLVGEKKQKKNIIFKKKNEMTKVKRWKWNRRKCRV
jgi:hypothetical protein